MTEDILHVDEVTFPQIQKTSSIIANQTYSWINNTGFYASMNPTYYAYYYNNVRRVSYWLDGFVPNFHVDSNGIFSTRIGNALVNSIGEAIFGRELLFKNVGKEKDAGNENKTLKFIGEWAKKSNFQQEAKKATKYAQGLGTSLLKLNKSGNDLWVEALRLDYFYFETTARNELKEVVCLLKGYTDTTRDPKVPINFYLVEKRYFEYVKQTRFARNDQNEMTTYDEIVQVPYVVYQVHRYEGNILNNQNFNTSLNQDVHWDSIPKRVRDSIKKDYFGLEIGAKKELPFGSHLGAYLVTSDEGNISLPHVPFGTSVLENIVGYLMAYDIAFSYFFRDMYHGKSTVLVPKYMQQNIGRMGANAPQGVFTGLDTSMFTTFETTSQEKQTIEQVQFNLRSMEWVQIRDYLIENIAMTLQLSTRTIASWTGASGIKTATEVRSEDDASITFVTTRRAVLEKPLNKLLEDIKDYYKLQDRVEVRFSKEGVMNQDQLINRVGQLLQLGLIDTFSALKEIMIDADEEQVKERYESIKREQQEKMKEQMDAQMQQAQGMQLM